MNEEQLTNAIREGIDNSLPSQVLKGVGMGLFCGFFIIGLFVVHGVYLDYKFEKEFCGENGCLMAIPTNPCFPLKNLNCHVVIGNETNEEIWQYFQICGYQEANAMIERITPQLEIELKNIIPNWEIKRFECN